MNSGKRKHFYAASLSFFFALANPAIADLSLYSTDFDSMDPALSLGGQEFWETNDPDFGLGFGATSGLGEISLASGRSNAGFIGGFFRAAFPPGKTQVVVGPLVSVFGTSAVLNVDFVLNPSSAGGTYAIDDTFSWSAHDQNGTELLRIAFEPTMVADGSREIVSYDTAGFQRPSGLNLFTGSLYRLKLEVLSETGTDRVIATINDLSNDIQVADFLIPSGTVQHITQFAANWCMPNGAIDPSTGIVTGFGSNFMIFDNYSVTTDAPGVVYAANITAREGMPTADLTVAISDPLPDDLEVSYQTSNGLALSGSDYAASNSSTQQLLIPAGSLSATIPLAITDDATAEAIEQFTVQLTGTNGSTTVASPSVKVNIVDNDDNDGDGISNEWENLFGLDEDAPEDALEDLDSDGMTNLFEYALGLNPTMFDSAVPLIFDPLGTGTFSYERNVAYTNLEYRVEQSDSLMNWMPLSDIATSLSSNIETREGILSDTSERSFIRFSIQTIE